MHSAIKDIATVPTARDPQNIYFWKHIQKDLEFMTKWNEVSETGQL